MLDVRSADLDASQRDTITGFITARASRFDELDVVSAADLRDLVELQANKLSAGCEDDATSCMAELADALGAQLVLTTRAGKLDAVFVVTLALFDARSGSSQGRTSVEAWTLADLPPKLGPALDELLGRATGAKPRESVAATSGPQGFDSELLLGMRVGGGIAVAVGVGAFSIGLVPGVIYSQRKNDLVVATAEFGGSDDEIARAQQLQNEANDARNLYNNAGRWAVVGGTVLVVGGTAALVASFFLPSSGGEE